MRRSSADVPPEAGRAWLQYKIRLKSPQPAATA